MKSDDDSWSIPLRLLCNRVSTWGNHEELKIFLSNRLIPSQFNQELSYKGESSSVFKGDFARNSRTVWSGERWIWWPRSHADRGPSIQGDRGHDCASIGPWSLLDRGPLLLWCLFRHPMKIATSRCIHKASLDDLQTGLILVVWSRSTDSFNAFDLMKIGSSSWRHVS